jgi:hypothetical protein
LWAGLIAFSSFILIARSANREGTFIASNKGLPIHCNFYFITTDLAYLPTQFFNRCYLQNQSPSAQQHLKKKLIENKKIQGRKIPKYPTEN